MFYGPLELARLALVRADVVAADARTARRFEEETGEHTYVIRGWVSEDEQEATFEEGQAEGFRAAPPKLSRHPLGAGIDRGIVGHVTTAKQDQADPLYKRLAEIAVEEGLVAGYYFKSDTDKPDPYHFEANETLAVSEATWAALVKERQRRVAIVGAFALIVVLIVAILRKRRHV